MMINAWIFLLVPLSDIPPSKGAGDWGFYGHRLINEMAIYTLPPEISEFYRYNREQIIEHSTDPDNRRYSVKGEGAKHFMDMDHYPDSFLSGMPVRRGIAMEILGEDHLDENGILPWNIEFMIKALTVAFSEKNTASILKLSTELGHYLGDANVPLHTVSNYNGQKTGQHGIHALWESRLPEIFGSSYFLATGEAQYLEDPSETVWQYIKIAHSASDSVLLMEKALCDSLGSDRKYSFEQRGRAFIRTESREYSLEYHRKLNGMVERQMRSAIRLTGSIWYTCWVNAGMPQLPFARQAIKWERIPRRKGIPTRSH